MHLMFWLNWIEFNPEIYVHWTLYNSNSVTFKQNTQPFIMLWIRNTCQVIFYKYIQHAHATTQISDSVKIQYCSTIENNKMFRTFFVRTTIVTVCICFPFKATDIFFIVVILATVVLNRRYNGHFELAIVP